MWSKVSRDRSNGGSFNALTWSYAASAARTVAQFIVGIILARLLGPDAFGLVAVGLLLISLGGLFADFGFAAALIQRESLHDRDVRFSFTMQLAIGAALSLGAYFGAGRIAELFNKPDVQSIVRAMSPLFLIQAAGQTAIALLRRSMKFKAVQLTSLSSYLVGYVLVGVPLALYGFGAWSLVAAHLTQACINSIAMLRIAGIRMRPALRPVTPGMFSFGAKVIGLNIANWGISNVDSVVVGQAIGTRELGLYNRCLTFVSAPMTMFTMPLQSVLFAASSRVQDRKEQLRRAHVASTTMLGLGVLPMYFAVASVSGTVISGLLGDEWVDAETILAPLALAMAVHSLLAIVGPILIAQDKADAELRVQSVVLVMLAPAAYLAAQYSINAVAWTVLGVYGVRWFLITRSLQRTIGGTWTEIVSALKWPLLCGVAAAGAAHGTDRLLSDVAPSVRLVADVAASLVALVVMIRLFGSRIMVGPHGDYLRSNSGRLGRFFGFLGVSRGRP